MPLDNFPLMALGLPNRNRCWLNQALFETKPKGILFKKLPGFFMFLFPGKSLVLFINFFPSLSHPADRIKYLFHPITPPSEYEFRSNHYVDSLDKQLPQSKGRFGKFVIFATTYYGSININVKSFHPDFSLLLRTSPGGGHS